MLFARLITIVSQAWLFPAEHGRAGTFSAFPREAGGELSDLVGDEPLIKALYNMPHVEMGTSH
jgi:hypothetical protein